MAIRMTRGRRLLLAAGTLGVLVLVVLLVINVAEFLGRTTRTSEADYTPAAKRLRVTADGTVRITGADRPDVHVVTTLRYGLSRPKTTAVSDRDGLALSADCVGITGSCSASLTITVPTDYRIEIRNSSGDIRIRGVAAVLDATTSSGSIRLDDVSGPSIDVRAGSGNVTGTGLRSPRIVARANSGEVRLWLVGDLGTVEARANSGDVRLHLPGTGPYRVETRTGSGDADVQVPVDSSSSLRVTARTGSGDVTVTDDGFG